MNRPNDTYENRIHQRRPLRAVATIMLPGNQEIEVHTLDLSRGGMAIVANANPRQGTEFGIRVTLPLRQRGSGTLEARVRVVHSILARDEGGFKVGLQFIGIDANGQSVIDEFLS